MTYTIDALLTDENVSSICGNQRSPKRAQLLEETRQTLIRQRDKLLEIMAAGFTAEQIVGLFRYASDRLNNDINTLAVHAEALKKIFTPEELVVALNVAGKNFENNIKIIVKSASKIDEITKRSPYAKRDVAEMLNSSASYLELVINEIYNRREKLFALGETFRPKQITEILKKCPSNRRGALIDQLHKSMCDELAKGTEIPPGSNIRILSQNHGKDVIKTP